jgi:putative ABC transport system ATP-binding protein
MTGQKHHNAFISVAGLTYAIDGQPILSDISFEVHVGERVAVFGPSGAGKSTLIRLINRLDEPTAGLIRLNGEDYRQIPPGSLRRRLGMVMQAPNLFPGTVADNLCFGPSAHGETLTEDEIRALLSGVDLVGYENRDVSSLSGGEAQRVNLARTLANKPEALLLDEPTSALDQAAKNEVEETIKAIIKSQNMTFILVTHDRAQVERLADRVLLLEGGQLVADGSVKEVLDARAVD